MDYQLAVATLQTNESTYDDVGKRRLVKTMAFPVNEEINKR